MKLPAKVQHWDDERSYGNGIIVTLHYGHCFDDPGCHVRGFDTVKEARQGIKYSQPCSCPECQS